MAPLLNVYGISDSFNTFTIREVAIIVVFILCGLVSLEGINQKIDASVILTTLFLLSIVLSILVNSIGESSGYVLRVIRCMMLYVYVFFLAQNFFDYEYGLRIYKYLVVFASVVVFAQVISANIFSYPLKGYLDIFPIRSDNLIHANMLRRFYSIFEEPGYFGMISSGYFLISIFSNRKEYVTLGLIAIAGLLTTATTSIVCLAFVAILYILFSELFSNSIYENNKWNFKAALVIICFIAFYIFVNSTQFDTVLYRLTEESSTQDRFSGYDTFYDVFSNYPILIKLLGNAMQEYPISGFAAIIMAYGIFGTIFLLSLMMYLLAKTHYVGKFLLILFLFLNIGNVEFMGNASTLLCFFGFILTNPPNQRLLHKYSEQ